MTAFWILAVVVLFAVSSLGPSSGAPPSGLELVVRGRATWAFAPAESLGVVLGGEAQQAIAARGAWAVACGPMFDRQGPQYLVRDDAARADVATRWPSRGATVAVVERLAYVMPGAEALGAAAVAVQGYPRLVEAGRTVAVQAGDRTRRVALAVMAGGRVVALVSFTGTMAGFARELVDGGAVDAVYLDGGRAAHLAAGGVVVFGHGAERPAAWITLGRI